MRTTQDEFEDKGNTPGDSDSSSYEQRKDELTKKIIDDDNNLELRTLNSANISSLGIEKDDFIEMRSPINDGGGQSLPYDSTPLTSNLDYFLFVPLLAHELAKKRSLELQIEKAEEEGESLGIKSDLSDVSMIDIDSNLNAVLIEEDDDGTNPIQLVAGYSWRDIRKQGRNFVQMAYSAIEKDDPEVVEYLKKRGFLKKGSMTDDNIAKIVKNILGSDLRSKLSKKLITKVSFASPKDNPRGKREQNFAGVVHKNAVYIGMYGSSYGGRVVLFSEYFPHIDSKRWSRELSTKQKLEMAKDVSNVLIFLYRVGAVSRDIKPDNVLTDGQNTKVLDMGLVKHEKNGESFMESLTGGDSLLTNMEEKPIIGTAYFMSPEQARGDNTDIRADIWGLGGTLYYALTGMYPNQESDLPFMGNDKVVLKIVHNLLSNASRPKQPDLKPFEEFYFENMGKLGKALTYSRATDYFRKKARQYAHDAIAVLAGARSFNKDNRYDNPEDMKSDLESLIGCRRPKNILKKIKSVKSDLKRQEMLSPKGKTLKQKIFGSTEDSYKSEAFERVESRPRYIFQKMRNAFYATVGAAAGAVAYMPEKVIGFIPENADQYLHMINDAVQKVL